VRAVLRRQLVGGQPLTAATVLVSGGLRMNRATRQVWLDGTELVLTPRAAMLLDYLMAHPGEVYSRDRLVSALWGYAVPASNRAVDQRVAELRRVLGEAQAARYVETVPGQGYRFCGKVVRG